MMGDAVRPAFSWKPAGFRLTHISFLTSRATSCGETGKCEARGGRVNPDTHQHARSTLTLQRWLDWARLCFRSCVFAISHS